MRSEKWERFDKDSVTIKDGEIEELRFLGIYKNVSESEIFFNSRLLMYNLDLEKTAYNRLVEINNFNLTDTLQSLIVRYCKLLNSNNDLVTEVLPYPGSGNYNGIPPGGYVSVFSQVFKPLKYLDFHKGDFISSLSIVPYNPETRSELYESYFKDDTLVKYLNINHE
jgi:hypothetical protein